MTARDEFFQQRIEEAIAESHDLPHAVRSVMVVLDDELRELRDAYQVGAREADNARTHAQQVERELGRVKRSIKCECPWMDGQQHLDPHCPTHQRMD